jgi:hypothetical protein
LKTRLAGEIPPGKEWRNGLDIEAGFDDPDIIAGYSVNVDILFDFLLFSG